MSPLVLIIKVANWTHKDNDVPKLIVCTRVCDIWMRPYIEKPEHLNQRLELTGLANPCNTGGLTGTGAGLALPEAEGRFLGRFSNGTKSFSWFKPGPLLGYPNLLPTLGSAWEQFDVPWNWRSSELRDTLCGSDRASLEMHSESVIERLCRCSWRR